MKYTKEQLMPKRYPEHKPIFKSRHKYWVIHKDGDILYYWWCEGSLEVDCWDAHVSWFIDIPGAPDEVKPLAWTRGETEVNPGQYLCHRFDRDVWEKLRYQVFTDVWIKESGKIVGDIDYYIPIRLDKEVMSWKQLGHDCGEPWGKPTNDKDEDVSEDDVKTYIVSNHKMITNDTEITNWCVSRLECVGYDVVKREPEIVPCPNPECSDNGCFIIRDEEIYWIRCPRCGYEGPKEDTPAEAIRLHNLTAERR